SAGALLELLGAGRIDRSTLPACIDAAEHPAAHSIASTAGILQERQRALVVSRDDHALPIERYERDAGARRASAAGWRRQIVRPPSARLQTAREDVKKRQVPTIGVTLLRAGPFANRQRARVLLACRACANRQLRERVTRADRLGRVAIGLARD